MGIKHVVYHGPANPDGQKPGIGVAVIDPSTGDAVNPAEPVLGALFSDLLTTVETDRIFAKVRAGEKP